MGRFAFGARFGFTGGTAPGSSAVWYPEAKSPVASETIHTSLDQHVRSQRKESWVASHKVLPLEKFALERAQKHGRRFGKVEEKGGDRSRGVGRDPLPIR